MGVLTSDPLLVLFIVVALGAAIGRLRLGGVSLGPAAALFAGLAVSAVNPDLAELPPIIPLFGLALFIYTIGLASGPAFFGGLVWRPIESEQPFYVKLTAGPLHGYTGQYQNKVPFNSSSGWAPAIIPGVGYCVMKRYCGEFVLLGTNAAFGEEQRHLDHVAAIDEVAFLLAIGAIDSATRAGFLVLLPFLLIAKGGNVTVVGFALTLVFIGFALVMAASAAQSTQGEARRAGGRALAAGIALYLVYVASIGGDFMSGRFFAAPFFGAVLVLTRLVDADRRVRWSVASPGPLGDAARPPDEDHAFGHGARYEHKARTVYGHEVWYFRYRRI